MLKKVLIGAAVAAVLALGLLAFSITRDYQQLTLERVRVSGSEDLRQAFDALPGHGVPEVDVTPLSDPLPAWLARWRLLANARAHIDVAYFILDGDVFGLSFLGALLAAAERGVHVRILVDGMATDMADFTHTLLGDNFLGELGSHPQIEVRTYRPVHERVTDFLTDPSATQFIASEHDKILSVDGRWALTGGRNISRDYFTPAEIVGRQFIDTDVLIDSAQVARGLTNAFERVYAVSEASPRHQLPKDRRAIIERAHQRMLAWLTDASLSASTKPAVAELDAQWQRTLDKLAGHRDALSRLQPRQAQRAEAWVIDTPPRDNPEPGQITRSLVRLIRSAKREITFVNPYLALGESTVSALADAAASGVIVTVLTNGPTSSDNTLAQALFLDQWPTLLARIPSMRLFVLGGGDTLHSKVLLFDHTLSLVGSYNLDPTAMKMSSELMVGLWSESLNGYFRQQVRRRTQAGRPSVYEYTIRRGPRQTPLLDDQGQPQIEFGPSDHLTPAQLARTRRYTYGVNLVRGVLRLEPLVRDVSSEDGAAQRQ